MAIQEAPAGAADIEAAALVAAPPEDVFAFLADLRNHWELTDRFVEVLELDAPPGRPANGGRVRIHGPLGIRRTATTRVTAAREPRLMIGVAELGEPDASTRARVSWTLAGRLGQTRVLLSAEIQRTQPLDRVLLTLGGRAWLHRRFERTLERLAAHFASQRLGLDDDPARAALE